MAIIAEVDIVFTGLCSFLNLRDSNGTMPEPSVILPRAPGEVPHVPFIAYDKREVQLVAQAGGGDPFSPVEFSNSDYYHRRLDSVAVSISDDKYGPPNVLPSFDYVAKKDDYWPGAKDQWDRKYVPYKGELPNPLVVAAFMRLGGGNVSAERMTDFRWEFKNEAGTVTAAARYYAQEVLYRIFPYPSDTLTVTLKPIGAQGQEEAFQFKTKRANTTKIRIWIGNNDKNDIHKALIRISTPPRKASHFEFLNDVASLNEVGPIPFPVVPQGTFPDDGGGGLGGGSDTGYCGPANGNGG